MAIGEAKEVTGGAEHMEVARGPGPPAFELGTMLVTTPEQTLVDLVLDRAADAADVREATRGLARKVDWAKVEQIAGRQRGGGRAMVTLRALRDEVTT